VWFFGATAARDAGSDRGAATLLRKTRARAARVDTRACGLQGQCRPPDNVRITLDLPRAAALGSVFPTWQPRASATNVSGGQLDVVTTPIYLRFTGRFFPEQLGGLGAGVARKAGPVRLTTLPRLMSLRPHGSLRLPRTANPAVGIQVFRGQRRQRAGRPRRGQSRGRGTARGSIKPTARYRAVLDGRCSFAGAVRLLSEKPGRWELCSR